TSEISLQDALFNEDNNLGTFLNGFLYWFASTNIVALSVKDLVVSEINLPNPRSYTNSRLGTWYGRLCMITDTNLLDIGHDIWVIKKQGVEISWSKVGRLSLILKPQVVSVAGLLQDEVDPMVFVMKVEKVPLESYADIGGLDAQIQEIKEVVELSLTHPKLYEDIGIKPPKDGQTDRSTVLNGDQ
ncbi:hypothetical protein Tco_1151749, partial [Tanacetum coccineum]